MLRGGAGAQHLRTGPTLCRPAGAVSGRSGDASLTQFVGLTPGLGPFGRRTGADAGGPLSLVRGPGALAPACYAEISKACSSSGPFLFRGNHVQHAFPTHRSDLHPLRPCAQQNRRSRWRHPRTIRNWRKLPVYQAALADARGSHLNASLAVAFESVLQTASGSWSDSDRLKAQRDFRPGAV